MLFFYFLVSTELGIGGGVLCYLGTVPINSYLSSYRAMVKAPDEAQLLTPALPNGLGKVLKLSILI